jgi:hypothetical protein
MCWCGVGLNPLKDVQGRESISLCHGQIWTANIKYKIKLSSNLVGLVTGLQTPKKLGFDSR